MLREVFEKWTHTRVQVPVAQRIPATLKWGGKSSRGPGSVAEIFVRTILGKTITVAIGDVLTTDDLLKQIGVKVNLSSSGHGLEPSCVVGPETTAEPSCVVGPETLYLAQPGDP